MADSLHLKLIERALQQALPKETTKPATIHRAMRYSLLAGGKRLRPLLCLAAAEACGRDVGVVKKISPLACALECLHTYSLIHDDLPAMDNDDLRRGKPTSHKVFGEGVAILTGDALLTKSFELLSEITPPKRYPLKSFLQEMSVAAGSQQLIAGQVADLEAEGKEVTLADVRFIHERKTAAMIVLSLRLGGMMANATPKELKALTEFGKALGLAFQIIDDILDVTQSSQQLGKSAGKDLAAKKATYPAVIGLEASRKEAAKLTVKAHRALKVLGPRAHQLELLANELLARGK
jgi:geranylgeranyl diphosphate synthase type II